MFLVNSDSVLSKAPNFEHKKYTFSGPQHATPEVNIRGILETHIVMMKSPILHDILSNNLIRRRIRDKSCVSLVDKLL